MGRVGKWVLAVGAVIGLAILYLHRQMKADSAIAKEERLLRKAGDGHLSEALDKEEARLKEASQRVRAAEEAADRANERFEAALQLARSLWFQTTGGG